MAFLNRLYISLLAITLTIPSIAFAAQITVPSASGSGYFLVSTTSGAYVASSSPYFASGITVSSCTGCGAGIWPFDTTQSNFGVAVQATTTPEWFESGLFASSTSQFDTINASGTTTAPIISGSSAPGGNLTLVSTSDATKGLIYFGSAQTSYYDAVNQYFHINSDGIGTAPNDTSGVWLQNSAPAVSGGQQASPSIVWEGQGWKTTATAGSQPVQFQALTLPVQGTTNPSGNWLLQDSVNGGAFTTDLTVTSAGLLEAAGGLASFNTTNAGLYVFTATAASHQTLAQDIFGGVSGVGLRTQFYGNSSTVLTANDNYGAVIVGSAPITEGTSGNHQMLANLVVKPIGTITNGVATVSNTAALYVDGAASATVTGNNWDLYASSTAPSYFGGNIGIATTTPWAPLSLKGGGTGAGTTFIATDSGDNTTLQLQDNGLLTLKNASSTILSATTLCLTGDTCRTSWPTGGSGSWPFTPSTNYGVAVQSTSTPEWFTAGMMASSTSRFVNASSTLASSRIIYLDNSNTGGALNFTGTGGVGFIQTTGLSNNGSILLGSTNSTNPSFEVSGSGGSYFSNGNLGVSSSSPGTILSLGSVGNFVNLSNTATSSFAYGINIASGCFAINGTCLTSGGSGTVTSVGLSDSNSTLTIGGSPVTTSGTLTATLNLAHANTWTGLQQFGNATSTLLTYTTAWGTKLNLTNASTTNLTASQSLYVGSNQVSGQRYPAWGYATSTTWTATSTVHLLAPFTGTLASIRCFTDVGTLNVQVYDNTTAMTPMFNASTTKGTITFTANNTFTSGDDLKIDFGTPATSPTSINCTGIATGY